MWKNSSISFHSVLIIRVMRYRDSSEPEMRIKILALIMLGLLLTAPFTQIAWGASVESGAGESNDDSADKENSEVTETVFNSIKLAAEARRDEVFSKISEDLPPSVLSDIGEALTLMEEAEGSEATMGEATQLYMQAMKLFRDSWNYIDDDAHMPTGETSGSDEPVLVDKQNENLNEEILIAKQQLLLRFKTNFQNRIETMYSHIQDLSGAMDPEDSAKAEKALVSAEEKLLKVQDNMTDGDLEDALIKLDDTSKGLEDEFKSLKDKEAADLIVTVDKLEGKVQKLTEENTRSSGKNSEASEDTNDEPEVTDEPKVNDEPKATDEPKVNDEPKATDEPKVNDEPKATDEPKGNSGASEDSSGESKVNGDSQKDSYKSTKDYINDLKERIRKSLEDFREKRSQTQASDDDSNEQSNDSGNNLKKVKRINRSYNNKNDRGHSNRNGDSNGNGNSAENNNANSNENGNGNSSENGNANSNENGNGNSSENGNANSNENGNGNSSENGNGNSSENGNGNSDDKEDEVEAETEDEVDAETEDEVEAETEDEVEAETEDEVEAETEDEVEDDVEAEDDKDKEDKEDDKDKEDKKDG